MQKFKVQHVTRSLTYTRPPPPPPPKKGNEKIPPHQIATFWLSIRIKHLKLLDPQYGTIREINNHNIRQHIRRVRWAMVGINAYIGNQVVFTWTIYSVKLSEPSRVRSITMLCGTSSIMRNMPSFMLNVRNIPHNIVRPVEHCYEFE